MSERFEAWPHDAEGIVREALREYVSDGDGEDEKVLAAYMAGVRAVARREGQAEAWDEGFEVGTEAGGRWAENGGPDNDDRNPYRNGEGQ